MYLLFIWIVLIKGVNFWNCISY